MRKALEKGWRRIHQRHAARGEAEGVKFATEIATGKALGFPRLTSDTLEFSWITGESKAQQNTRKTICPALGDRGSGVQISPLRPISPAKIKT